MTTNPAPICVGCREEPGVHPRDDGFYCDECADLLLGIAPPDEDEEDEFPVEREINFNSYGPGRP